MSKFQEKVCTRLRSLRAERGLTQEAVADELNLTPNGYAKIERGETEISLARVENLANYFKVDITYLLGLSETIVNMTNSGTSSIFCYKDTNGNNQYHNDVSLIKYFMDEIKSLQKQIDDFKK
jgi:transcriptional regulator with XRE-family HTH domain